MSHEIEEKKYLPICYIIKTIFGVIFVILGYLFFRYLGFVTIVVFLFLAVIITFYGLCFDHKVMNWLSQKYKND
jgi:hypothetical protein